MPNIDFPSSPFNGQTYLFNGNTWTYNGVAWVSIGTSGPQGATGPQGDVGPQGPAGGGSSITGTTNYVAKFNVSGDNVTDSSIFDDGSLIETNNPVSVNASLIWPYTNAPVGEIVYFGSGSLTTGDICYYWNGSWSPADALNEGKSKYLLGYSLGSDPGKNGMMIRGFVSNDESGGMTDGDILYLNVSGAPPYLTNTPPSGTGNVVRVVGYVVDAAQKIIYFNPDNTWITIV